MTNNQDYIPTPLNPEQQKLQDYFDHGIVGHDNMKKAYKELMETILHPGGVSIIFFYGPTGVGKTTIMNHVENDILRLNADEMKQDLGYMPVYSIRAIGYELGNFNWKDFFVRSLKKIGDPIPDKKVDYDNPRLKKVRDEIKVSFQKDNEPAFRRAFENNLKYRGTKVLLIDEAPYFLTMSSGRRIIDQVKAIRSLADESEALLVLFGTYDLLQMVNLNDQLGRRCQPIEFPAYEYTKQTDRDCFVGTLNFFQKRLPFEIKPGFEKDEDFFFLNSCGCIGIVKEWISSALTEALKSDERTINKKLLQAHALDELVLSKISKEIQRGKEFLLEREKQQVELRMRLGIPLEPKNDEQQPNSSETAATGNSDQNVPPPDPRRPFERGDGRDPVGSNNDVTVD